MPFPIRSPNASPREKTSPTRTQNARETPSLRLALAPLPQYIHAFPVNRTGDAEARRARIAINDSVTERGRGAGVRGCGGGSIRKASVTDGARRMGNVILDF